MSFFDTWKQTVEKLTHPVVQNELKQNKEKEVETEDEASTYAQAFLECLTTLDAELHGITDPQEVGLKALSAACDFYDADWCGVLDVDMKLELWMPFWWYNRNTGGMTTTKIGENGIAGFYSRWEEALEMNECIIIPDVEAVRETHPKEYEVFSAMGTKSLLAVPYRKRESGFMLLRNPKRYIDKPDILRILSFILVAEITEQKLVERMKMSASPKQITEASDIVINLFGGLEIYTAKGKLTETEFKSPLSCKVLLLLLMNRNRGVSARELSEQLWPDKEYDNPTGNIRTLLYRFRSAFRLISDYDLIVTTPNGYRINPELNIRTDFEQFEKGCETAKRMQNIQQKIQILGDMVKLYRGKMFQTGNGEHWEIAYISKYHLMYLKAVECLMELLYAKEDFAAIHEFATMAIAVEPDNPSIIYWLITSLKKHGAGDMAKEHLESAKVKLLQEDYFLLEQRLTAV